MKTTTNTNSDGQSPRSLPVVDGHTLVDGGLPQDDQIHLSLTAEYPSSSSSGNKEISSTGTTAEITFIAFIWCRIDDSYDGDNYDDTYAHDNCDYDSHNDDDKLLHVVIISLSSTIVQTGR